MRTLSSEWNTTINDNKKKNDTKVVSDDNKGENGNGKDKSNSNESYYPIPTGHGAGS